MGYRLVFLACLSLVGAPISAAALAITVEAPPALEATAARIRATETAPLIDALARAGLQAPADVRITLIAEDDVQARRTPAWVVGLASSTGEVTIFPARIGSYPYGSLDAVVRHEVVHLALFAQAGGRPLPRWFHEGVAVTVERDWGIASQLRLVLATAGEPALAELGRLFRSDAQTENARAYLLAAALVADVRRRHGAAVPGAIASHVARGVPFPDAFRLETDESPEEAAERTWRAYRRWTSWMPVVASASTLWSGILVLAIVAFLVRMRRRTAQRRRWDEEDDDS